MIPPEPDPPGPDPPEPVIPEYTYATSQPITLGSVTGTLYTSIQYNGSDCKLTATDSDHDPWVFDGLVLYDDVFGEHQCYFTNGTSYITGILGSNSGIGLSVPSYILYNGTVTQSGTMYIDSSTPSDYYSNVIARNFTLTQRS